MEQIETDVDGTGPLAAVLKEALAAARAYQGKIGQDALQIQGMSGKKFRFFINNLVEKIDAPRYLEVGSWKGSTFCSAIHKNTVTAVAIDNWTQFDGPIGEFFLNVSKHCSLQTKISILTTDFRAVNFALLGSFNIYFFDGPHSEQDQYDGVALALDALDDEFILIVDDWNWERVRVGTGRAIKELGLEILHQTTIRSAPDGVKPAVRFGRSDWHNGYFLSVMRKPARLRRLAA